MKTLLALLFLIPSLSWGLDKNELREELKYWKSLLDDGLINQEDYDNKKNKLLNIEITSTKSISEDNQKTDFKETNQNKFIPTHVVAAGRGITANWKTLDKGTKVMLVLNSCKKNEYTITSEDYECLFKTEDDFRFRARTYSFNEIGPYNNYDQNLIKENTPNTSSNDNKDYSNKNDSKKESPSNNDKVTKELKKQNEILKQQLEYQKKRDEKEDFRRNMDNFGNLIDSLTGSGKYYQPSTTQYCRNYGTAQHPNVICQ